MSLKNLNQNPQAVKRPRAYHRQRWGRWQLDAWKHNLVFCADWGNYSYTVDLSRITSSAQMLDWIFQFKGRGDPQDMADLLQAFHDILHPQANLCSSGADKRLQRNFLRDNLNKTPAARAA